MNNMKKIITRSPEETMELAERIARGLGPGDFIALNGELGAGKTVFVKGVAKGLGIAEPLYVNSPSFVVMKEYHGDLDLYHFDVYRLDPESFCDTLDYERYFYGDGVTVVEWADKIQDVLPEEYIEIGICHKSPEEREFNIRAIGDRFEAIVKLTHDPKSITHDNEEIA